MPTRDSVPAGAPCWIVLSTSDPQRVRDFYCSLFGWTADDAQPEFGGYFNFRKDGALVAGCQPAMPGTPDVWTIYLAVEDAQKTVDVAVDHGAVVHVAPMEVGDQGTMAFFVDAAGSAVGVWQPGAHPGLLVVGETGTPSWFELHTRDYEAAVAFYRDVFGWETNAVSDTPEFRYTTMVQGDEWLAGVMDARAFLADGLPSHWSVYIGVDDTDGALALVESLGGSVEMPAEDTPYGRLAVAVDPAGARFKLVAPNASMPAKG